MHFIATTERPIDEDLLDEARTAFLAAVEEMAAHGASGSSVPDNDDESSLRVLIVDDHRATTDTLFYLTGKWGYRVRRAYDGVTGLKLAAEFRPDVLLLDILMPNVDGFEVAMQVRRQVRLKHCFIIAVTGRTDALHRAQCYEAGVDLFLIKPVPPSDMETLLRLESLRVRQLKSNMTTELVSRELAVTG